MYSSQYISHNYAEQSTSEDPRMMAFFDSLVQRELECLAEETDSLDATSSGNSRHDHDSESSDTDQIVVDFLPLPPKRCMYICDIDFTIFVLLDSFPLSSSTKN